MIEKLGFLGLIKQRIEEINERWDRILSWSAIRQICPREIGPKFIELDKETKRVIYKTCPWQGLERTEGGGMLLPKVFFMCNERGSNVIPLYCQTIPVSDSQCRGFCEANTGKMAERCLIKLAHGRGRGDNQKGRPPYIVTLHRPKDPDLDNMKFMP